MLRILLGVMLSLSSTAIIGAFGCLQKKSLVGDVISHALLPGIVLAFMCTAGKMPLALTLGAFSSGMLALFLVDYLPVYSKLSKDTAMTLVVSVFFGVGLMLLTHVQQADYPYQAGLKHFLIGSLASLTDADIKGFLVFGLSLFVTLLLFFNAWKILSFDPNFAVAIGMPVHRFQLLFRTLTVWAIVVGVKTVGIVLIAAILITPATTASFWTYRLKWILVFSCCFASVGGLIGLSLSYRIANLPAGACIVVSTTSIGLLSFLFAPQKGFVARQWFRYQYRKKIMEENVLKAFCELAREKGKQQPYSQKTLIAQRFMEIQRLKNTMRRLCKKRLVQLTGPATWKLTQAGQQHGETVLRRHLLWEDYLKKYLNIHTTHVHNDAEAIEHVITPEIETLLEVATDDGSSGPSKK